jgi:uncharacterized protein YqhQ
MGLLFDLSYTFFALCVFVFLCVILTNLFLKSYKPQNTLVFIGGILILFFVNFVLAYSALQTVMVKVRQLGNDTSTVESVPSSDDNLPNVF